LEGTTPEERKDILHAAALLLPCWTCGEVGHRKVDCTEPQKLTREEAPSMYYDVASVLSAPQPFAQYCQVLGTVLTEEQHDTEDATSTAPTFRVSINETGLENNVNGHEDDPSQKGNWNKSRKSIYIVAAS
jgi:hypothetical protein